MTWNASITGHVADAATEEALISELQQFIIDLIEGFDGADVVLNGGFSGMHVGYRSLFSPAEITVDDLQKVVDAKAAETGAEGNSEATAGAGMTTEECTDDMKGN